MTGDAIRIEGLRKTYAGGKEALMGVDLSIPTGSIFGLLGPNGAGKSTLINILAGLVLKTSGKVDIWGWDQDRNPRQSRAAIGVMPQELNLDPFFTPRGALEVQAGLYGVPKAERRSDEILRMIQQIPEPVMQETGDNRASRELRTYGIGAQIIADLGIRKMRVMSAPWKLTGLAGFGLEVVEYIDPLSEKKE